MNEYRDKAIDLFESLCWEPETDIDEDREKDIAAIEAALRAMVKFGLELAKEAAWNVDADTAAGRAAQKRIVDTIGRLVEGQTSDE